MDPRPLPWALVLLGPVLALALDHQSAPEAPEKLCGHHFVRALVRVCGGPRWSLEGGRLVAGSNRELLQWPEGQHLLHGLVDDRDPMVVLAPQPLLQASQHHHHRRAAAVNPARHCCLSGCTRQDLLTLCPH
ncbi:insulin-like 3 [Pteropus alecto]|uniref:Insulin-like 3 n=1 Tax=Pteropus alecto TaxID=9402 RepID=L5L6A2_PTEAL|nr:insulin-like 3 [Pteropus alecto]ELK19167.1 Insulin-like 3 [Pteropus alecto]